MINALTMDGLIYASSMGMLDSARRKIPVAVLVRWLLGLGIVATLAANVRYGLGHGLIGAAVGGWPATALVGLHELLMVVIRGPQAQADVLIPPDCASKDDPLQEQAAQLFADDLAADHIPSIRVMRARLHVGRPRAQRVRSYLTALAGKQARDFAV